MKRALLVLLGLWAAFPAQSFHIIGGDWSYECLGNGRYRFVFKMYRDCSNPNGDYFDTEAPITVYRGNQAPYEMVVHTYIRIEPVVSVPPPDNPCLQIPPNVCVQEGTYIFELDLPPSNETYHVVYQRCCRNSTITNILTPDEVGSTFTVALSPEAQALCNNSPVFNDFPPTVICAGFPFEFDHSATDPDGDQLVYEFCAPLKGGGTVGFLQPGDPESCEGFRPDPGCPPPYFPVNYQPPYNPQLPLGNPQALQIDPVTGLITGTPQVQGQFVVGICVKEFRNGQLLSVIQRDFQFNVSSCEPTVVAQVQADSTLDEQTFVINACGRRTTLLNTSFQRNFIQDHFWRFDLGGAQPLVLDSWDATLHFPDLGTYSGELILNPGTECGDTARLLIHVLPEIHADFEFAYDTCVAGPVAFTDLSSAEASTLLEWQWRFGDGEQSALRNPQHLYLEPGAHPVLLQITDDNGCTDDTLQTVLYQPAPAVLLVAPDAFNGCEPASIFFENRSVPVDETYTVLWDFADGGQSNAISPTHTFTQPGTYDIFLSITSPLGCTIDTVFEELIQILPSPDAAFGFSPQQPSSLEPAVQFTDLSRDAAWWEWTFDEHGQSFRQHPLFTFPDTGAQIIQLVVANLVGCTDTALQTLDVLPLVTLHLPNAFTPNEDALNELFLPAGSFEGMRHFRLQIWNRWGELLFETTDPHQGWNGRKHNTGRPAPAGAYLVLVEFTTPRGERVQKREMVLLLR